MDEREHHNRTVWEDVSRKHVREDDRLLTQGRADATLTPAERRLLAPVLATRPVVVHLQSGHGLDDLDLVRAGARTVVGVDFSSVAVGAAQRRADVLGLASRYVVGEAARTPLRTGSADLVYTGKGALIWVTDLTGWASEVRRLLRPGGTLFVHEAHPTVPLWTWDADRPRIRPDRSYFDRTHVNDSFPANGAIETQWTLGEIVTTIAAAGLEVTTLEEYPDPFWQPDDVDAAAWHGTLPNAYALLAHT